MTGAKSRDKKAKGRQRKLSEASTSSKGKSIVNLIRCLFYVVLFIYRYISIKKLKT